MRDKSLNRVRQQESTYMLDTAPDFSQKMGKKSRVKTQKSGTGATASVSPKETLNLTSELLQSKSRARPSCRFVGRVGLTPRHPWPLYSQDRILQAMGNITLAFHLLCERADPNSFWQPYIQTLPNEYDTPLYFEEDEVRCLQSTQAIHDVLSQYKNTARQYAYFYKVIQVYSGPVSITFPLDLLLLLCSVRYLSASSSCTAFGALCLRPFLTRPLLRPQPQQRSVVLVHQGMKMALRMQK
ncbi:hypothetical protein CB1_000726026 [Camelus ferus]|nr:hypothetical protein CB1_000726026 [Camelus ferus]